MIPVWYFIFDGVKLSFYNFNSFVLLSLGQCLTETENDSHSELETVLNLFWDNFIILSKMSSSFGMSQNHPLNVNVLKLLRSDLSSVCTKGMHGAVLSSYFNIRLFYRKGNCYQMQINRCYNNVCVKLKFTNSFLIKLKLVNDISYHRVGLWQRVIAFPVCSDEDSSHS